MSSIYAWIETEAECLVGDSLRVTVHGSSGSFGAFDWVGVYPVAVPSVPGVSLARWLYIGDAHKRNGGKSNNSQSSSSESSVTLVFPPVKLPSHAGAFEVRMHRASAPYEVVATARVAFRDAPRSLRKSLVMAAIMLVCIQAFQWVLNAKGTCDYTDPVTAPPDPIDDAFVRATVGINAYWAAHPADAAAAQALSSALLDASLLVFCYVAAFRRSTARPFLAIFTFMALRFVAQAMALIPCPPGFLWPRGAFLGVDVPTLFCDYHPANDMFFSGHAGTTVVIALELLALDYFKAGIFQLLVVLPYVCVWVVSVRVHRGVDVFAGILAAYASCALAEKMADPIDRALEVIRDRKNKVVQQKAEELRRAKRQEEEAK